MIPTLCSLLMLMGKWYYVHLARSANLSVGLGERAIQIGAHSHSYPGSSTVLVTMTGRVLQNARQQLGATSIGRMDNPFDGQAPVLLANRRT